MKHVLIVMAFSPLLTAACAPADRSDPAADRQAIAAVTAQTQAAENAGSVEQMQGHFADDLVMMGPNMPAVAGADSVAAAMRAFFETFTMQIEYSNQEIVVLGDWAFDRGTYRQTLTPKSGGDPVPQSGKYLWLYRRHSDGSWKQSRVIWNSSEPMPTGGA